MQVSSGKATLKVDASLAGSGRADPRQGRQLKPDFVQFDGNSVKARFADLDAQRKAKDALGAALNPDPNDPSYIVALNLLSRSPQMADRAARAADVPRPRPARRRPLPDAGRHEGGADQEGRLDRRRRPHAAARQEHPPRRHQPRRRRRSSIRFRDARHARTAARTLLADQLPDLQWVDSVGRQRLQAHRHPQARRRQARAGRRRITQNITTLHNRVNELGVAEPVIQQQGADRIVVELPGVQDTAKAKDIIGRTATLEMRMVDDSPRRAPPRPASARCRSATSAYVERRRHAGRRQAARCIFTGENLTDAQPGFDEQTSSRRCTSTVDAKGARIMRDVSRDNIGKRMAILLFEKGKGEVVTAPVIRGELGNRFQISGRMTHGRGQRHGAAAARRLARRADGDHRGTHDRPEPGRREHRQGLPQRDVRLRRDRRVHVRVLPAVRRDLDAGAGVQPAAAGRRAVDAAGDADLAGHRRHRARARHGDRRQRADQRAHARGTARRRRRRRRRSTPATSAPGRRSSTRT